MQISETLRQEIAARLTSAWGGAFKCPLCRSKDMGMSDRIFGVLEHKPDNGGHLVPLLFVACLKCGYTIPINPLMLGVALTGAIRKKLDGMTPVVVPQGTKLKKDAEATKAVRA